MIANLKEAFQKPAVHASNPDDTVSTEASIEFVNSEYIRELTDRALSYLAVGYPIHLAGPSGTGKTTLAFHIAAQLKQPVSLIHGDDEFGSSDLIGKNSGFKTTKMVDNYIHTVLKTEEEMTTSWQDNRLTTACRNGYTLIYDEFTRSRPEANNAMLSVLEEKILNLPRMPNQRVGYLDVHPNFKAIFTSNPEEYAGVHKTQDALMDRLITIHLGVFNRKTEMDIVMSKSDLPRTDAGKITDIVRKVRNQGTNHFRPSIRASIAIAKVLVYRNGRALKRNPDFQQICLDVLSEDLHSYDLVKKAFNKVMSGKNNRPLKPIN